MDNKELAKELLGYTYIDIQKIPETYRLLGIDVDKFKEEHDEADYESALYTLMDSKASNVIFRFLMNPLNRLKNLAK
jgi:hypothetical protein